MSSTTIEGRIERITYRSPDTHFMIARFRVAEDQKPVTVMGHMPEPRPGETLRLSGAWQHHPRYGQQFKVDAFETLLPADVEEIRRYLSEGLIKGIGPRTAGRLIRHFKAHTLEVIEKTPQRLAEVQGIGEHTAQRIGEAWREHHAVRAMMQLLQACGVKPAFGARIYKLYGAEAAEVLKSDPYQLAQDMPRVGFPIADAIARHLDLPVEETRRAEGGLRHLLETALEDGHMYIPMDHLAERCSNSFELDYRVVQTALEQLAADRQIKLDRRAPETPVYLYPLYQAETRIARRLQALQNIPMPSAGIADERIMAAVLQRMAISLSETQLAVLQSALRERVVVITGGPGTGKTTLTRAIAAVFDAVGKSYMLAAPTGRAARRMAEITGRRAATLHKLLGYNLSEGRFERDQDDPLQTEAVVVDEASMVDALLMGHLIQALPAQATLILVGDVFQLPSVGPGSVLADLIGSRLLRVFELREVFRQAAQSPIIANAHCVRRGQMPVLKAVTVEAELEEFAFIEQDNPQKCAQAVVDLCARFIPEQFGLDGTCDVQVVTPVHKGPVGTLNLNRMLQARLNPGQGGLNGAAGRFRPNDKVMHLRNNYQKAVFNGEIGTVSGLDSEKKHLTVGFDGRQVVYDEADLDELTLGYAISVHKSQGSEYPVIVMPLVTQHYVMLQRNLLYTALTRARRIVILVGSAKAVRIAVETDKPRQRRSLLGWRLNPDSQVLSV